MKSTRLFLLSVVAWCGLVAHGAAELVLAERKEWYDMPESLKDDGLAGEGYELEWCEVGEKHLHLACIRRGSVKISPRALYL